MHRVKYVEEDNTLLKDKYVYEYDLSLFSVVLGANIGLMMRDKVNEWSFYYYIACYSIFSINQQLAYSLILYKNSNSIS